MKKGATFVLLGAALWATIPLFSKIASAHGVDSITASAWRSYLAAGIFLVWFLCDGTLRKIRLRELPFYLLYGLFGACSTGILYMMAIARLSTAMAAMLLYTAPAFVILFNRLFYREPITRTKLIALLCTFGGCFLVVRGYDPASLALNLPGVLIGLCSGISFSMVTVMGIKANRMHDSRTNTGMMFFAGAILFAFIRPPWTLAAPTLPLWGSYLGLAVVCGVAAFSAYLHGMKLGVEGGVASILATAEPVIATLLGVLLFDDLLEALQVLGIAIVIAGMALPFWKERRQIKGRD